MPHRILILAYGNPLRSDDGFAWHAAEMLRPAAQNLAAEILCEYQLTPELAATASTAELVIFIDAACNGQPGQIACTPVLPHPEPPRFSHQLAPEQIIALCGELYDAHPRAYAISVTGESFEHGEELTATVRDALPSCVSIAEELMARCDQPEEPASKMEAWYVVHCDGHEAEVW
ncbi:MAG TPA: hydrogenase maturation protease [Terracidiphilus sp.]|nr:hydrogenase maturation protease [Terracidiphilus sp.]